MGRRVPEDGTRCRVCSKVQGPDDRGRLRKRDRDSIHRPEQPLAQGQEAEGDRYVFFSPLNKMNSLPHVGSKNRAN